MQMQSTAVALNRQTEPEWSVLDTLPFASVPNRILFECEMNSRAFKLYTYFLSTSWRKGDIADSSLKQISSKLGWSKKSVIRNIKKLIEAGYIEKLERGENWSASNEYQILNPARKNFTKVSSVLLLDRKLPLGVYKVYVKLLSYDLDKEGYVKRTMKKIAEELGLKISIIEKHIKELVKLEFIRIEQERHADGYLENVYVFLSLEDRYCEPGNPRELKAGVKEHLEAILDDETLNRIGIERKKRTDKLFQIQDEVEEKRGKAEASKAKSKAIKNKYGKRLVESEDQNPTTKRPTVHDLERVWHREEREKSPPWRDKEWGMARNLIKKYTYDVLVVVIEDISENWTWYQKQYGLKDLQLGYLFGNMDMWIQDLDREKGDDDLGMWEDEMEEVWKEAEYKKYQGKGCSNMKWPDKERKTIGEVLKKYGPIRTKRLIEKMFENWDDLVQRWPNNLKAYPAVRLLGAWAETWITLFERGEIEVRSTRQKALDEAEYKGERKGENDFVSF